ncbi:proline-rich receptor-like protein kinase PERK8 [Iris pallida]|uniref:Proline-rich receptor-like protein kinase PERK8 n=1 Tax=Iris pallida TaxID=29817 RepID=A0AAX6GXF8_IRIPA|nr:proline-rich receptor-like protein kinase PERK8 [Iris pallida]
MERTVVSGDGQDGSARATVRSNGGCRKSRRLEKEGSVCAVLSTRHGWSADVYNMWTRKT